jgi:hypothetical protein
VRIVVLWSAVDPWSRTPLCAGSPRMLVCTLCNPGGVTLGEAAGHGGPLTRVKQAGRACTGAEKWEV